MQSLNNKGFFISNQPFAVNDNNLFSQNITIKFFNRPLNERKNIIIFILS